MSLTHTLNEYISACFTGIWIESYEHEDALREIAQLCREQGWRMATWNIDSGLHISGAEQPADTGGSDPLAAIRSINALSSPESSAILVLQNFHRFMQSAEVVQALVQQVVAGKQNRAFVIILAPSVDLPEELEKLFTVISHDLPGRDQLEEIAAGVATEEGEMPESDERARLLDAAAGLTRMEAENAFALSLVRHQRLQPDVVWQLKGETLKKSGLLTLHRGGETFSDLGGLEALKSFCRRALGPKSADRPKARGVVLLGPPGVGKTAIAKACGNETGRPTLILDPGSLMGSLVGQTEQRTRQALRIIDAFGPSIVVIDEVDHALAGHNGSGDSGVMSRFFGAMQTWLNDHISDAFVVCTSNDISTLPSAFTRAERFDAVYFVDLPGSTQRRSIWRIYLGKYGLRATQTRPVDNEWSGAEIKACCRLAAMLDVSLVEAAEHVVPVAKTAAESIEQLRNWASGRCLDARRGSTAESQGKAGPLHGGAIRPTRPSNLNGDMKGGLMKNPTDHAREELVEIVTAFCGSTGSKVTATGRIPPTSPHLAFQLGGHGTSI